jgi:hypothetical protein
MYTLFDVRQTLPNLVSHMNTMMVMVFDGMPSDKKKAVKTLHRYKYRAANPIAFFKGISTYDEYLKIKQILKMQEHITLQHLMVVKRHLKDETVSDADRGELQSMRRKLSLYLGFLGGLRRACKAHITLVHDVRTVLLNHTRGIRQHILPKSFASIDAAEMANFLHHYRQLSAKDEIGDALKTILARLTGQQSEFLQSLVGKPA